MKAQAKKTEGGVNQWRNSSCRNVTTRRLLAPINGSREGVSYRHQRNVLILRPQTAISSIERQMASGDRPSALAQCSM